MAAEPGRGVPLALQLRDRDPNDQEPEEPVRHDVSNSERRETLCSVHKEIEDNVGGDEQHADGWRE